MTFIPSNLAIFHEFERQQPALLKDEQKNDLRLLRDKYFVFFLALEHTIEAEFSLPRMKEIAQCHSYMVSMTNQKQVMILIS